MRFLSLLALVAALLAPGCASPPHGEPDPALFADTPEAREAVRWAREFLERDPRVASYEVAGPGELAVRTTSGDELSIFLDNLVIKLAVAEPARHTEIIAEYERGLRETLISVVNPTAPLRAQLVPIVRRRDYVARMRADGGPTPLLRPVAGETVVLLAYDTPRSIQIPPRQAIYDLGLDEAAAFEVALENLRLRSEELAWKNYDGMVVAQLDGHYESSLLLVDGVIDSIEAYLGGPVALAVPARDLLAVVRADRPADVARLRQLVADTASGPRAVTQEIMVRNEGAWEVLP